MLKGVCGNHFLKEIERHFLTNLIKSEMSQGYDLYQVGLYEEFITLEYTGGPKILIRAGVSTVSTVSQDTVDF